MSNHPANLPQAHGPGRIRAHRIYVVPGDITQLSAHVLVYTTDIFGNRGFLYHGFEKIDGFTEAWESATGTWQRQPCNVGDVEWLRLTTASSDNESGESPAKPGAVVVTVVTAAQKSRNSGASEVSLANIHKATRAALEKAIEQGMSEINASPQRRDNGGGRTPQGPGR